MRARVVLNALALCPRGSGVQTYIRELTRHLTTAATAELAVVVQRDAIRELPEGVERVIRPNCSSLRRAIHGLRGVGRADLVHGLDVDLPLHTTAPTVATVHDLAVFDVPWTYPRRRVVGERVLVSRAVRRADVIIAVSQFTAERVRDHFGRTARVIHEAPAPEFGPPSRAEVDAVRQRRQLPHRFVLHVGTIEPRKNLTVLGDACHRARIPLVLAGKMAGTHAPIGAQRLGYVPRSEMRALYGAATVVAYPSVYEGFGLPPLEAMACGAAVVASRLPSLQEVLSDGATLVDSRNADGLASVLHELTCDGERRRALAAQGLRRARQFSWSATAQATCEVYRSLGVAV